MGTWSFFCSWPDKRRGSGGRQLCDAWQWNRGFLLTTRQWCFQRGQQFHRLDSIHTLCSWFLFQDHGGPSADSWTSSLSSLTYVGVGVCVRSNSYCVSIWLPVYLLVYRRSRAGSSGRNLPDSKAHGDGGKIVRRLKRKEKNRKITPATLLVQRTTLLSGWCSMPPLSGSS